MTRDEMMLWLNDRLGKNVHVEVVLAKAVDNPVFVFEGELRFWRDGFESHSSIDHVLRENMFGYYYVGDAPLDVENLEHVHEHLEGRERHRDEAVLELADGVHLVLFELPVV